MNVREPARIVTSAARRTYVSPRTTSTPDAMIGRSAPAAGRGAARSRATGASASTALDTLASAPPSRIVASAKACPRPLARQVRADIDGQHERHQHDTERKRERQVTLARFERNRRRHYARDALD